MNSGSTGDPNGTLSALRSEVENLRDDLEEVRRMLILVAGTLAVVEGQQNISHTYLRRALAEIEGTTTVRLLQEYIESEELTSDLESGLEIMTDRAREMDLQDLVDYLEE